MTALNATTAPPREPTRHAFRSQGLDLNFCTWGNPDAPVLILVHGGRDHALSWSRVAAAFSKDWYVVAPDLRGHGDSAHSPTGHYAMELFVLDIVRLAERFEDPLTIVGHSLGGNIALRFTALYPERVRRLVVMEGMGMTPSLQEKADAVPADKVLRDWFAQQTADGAATPRRFTSVQAAAERMMKHNPHVGEELARELIVQGAHVAADGSVAMKFDPRLRAMSPIDITTSQKVALWRRITCPVLLIYGAESWAANPEEDGRMAAFRDARLAMFERAGHWIHHDRRDAFIQEVQQFLR